jgi:hypothetical protein
MINTELSRAQANALSMAFPWQVNAPPLDFALIHRAQVEKWRKCIAKLKDFLYLEDDWNSEGALAPFPENVQAAIDVVENLYESGTNDAPPQPIPGVDGEVFLLWEGLYCIEAEIKNPSEIEWTFSTPGQPALHARITIGEPIPQQTGATMPTTGRGHRIETGALVTS